MKSQSNEYPSVIQKLDSNSFAFNYNIQESKVEDSEGKLNTVYTYDQVIVNASTIDKDDIMDLIKNISKYHIEEEGGFPNENMRTTANIGAKGSCVIPVDLEKNVIWLHHFLFEDQEYTVTDRVKEYSKHIEEETYEYLHKKQ